MKRRDFLGLAGMAALTANRSAVPGSSRPNILFCLADDVSYPHMGAYGCRWIKTPGFDRVAREGLLFNRAYTPNAKCAPSRACILTGRNSWQLEEAANHWCYFPARFKTFCEALAKNGYHVGHTLKGWGPGVATGPDNQPRSLTGKAFNKRKTVPPVEHISDCDYAANFEDFLNSRLDDAPFFFWYGSIEPHRAIQFRGGIEKGGKKLSDIPNVPGFWPDNETVRTDLLDYAFEIEYFDRHLQQMLALLDRKGYLENTLVVVTADNGMPFPRAKGQAYEYSNHMPLAVMWKAGIQRPGRRIDDYVSFIDFAPTFLEIAKVDPNSAGMQALTGGALTDIFNSTTAGIVSRKRDSVLVGKERHDVGRPHDAGYPIRGIFKDGYLYLRNFEIDRWPAGNPETGYLNCDGSPTKTECLKARHRPETRRYWELSFGKRPAEELYCPARDPDCLQNLADRPQSRELKARLQKELFTRLREQNDPRILGNGHVFDRYPYADEKNRNFYERYTKGEDIRANWVNASDFEKLE
ncbi:MAG: heparan N-sulfatase [Acidobacteria bacterium]|nr:MAG: heparan N-sulfatase [Acidobacteriota bacterium]